MVLTIEKEITLESDPSVVAYSEHKLFVGTEDGSIKVFDENLNPVASWVAHSTQLFALTASENLVYSASNDGGIRVWSIKGEKKSELEIVEGDISILKVNGKELYAGDESGNIMVFENNALKARFNVLEEVKDIALKLPLMFTVKDLDVTVTEIKPDSSKTRFTTRHTMEGRAPLCLTDKYLVAASRTGNNLQLHENSIDSKFKKLHEIKVSDMIITSISICGDYIWTGGWDGFVRRWRINNQVFEEAGEIKLGACINGLTSNISENIYAIVTGAKIFMIKSH